MKNKIQCIYFKQSKETTIPLHPLFHMEDKEEKIKFFTFLSLFSVVSNNVILFRTYLFEI